MIQFGRIGPDQINSRQLDNTLDLAAMYRGMRAVILVVMVALTVAACGGHRPAPVHLKGSSPGNAATPSGAFGTGPQVVGVRHGDTVYAISRRTGATVRAIIEHNRLRAPYRLKPGQRLRIPGPLIHTVRKGETVYSISRRYGIDMASLVRANYVRRPYNIAIDQKLVVPGRTAGSAISTPRTYSGSKSAAVSRSKTKKTPLSAPPKRAGKHFSWPVKGKVISRFGPKAGGLHNDGINIAVKKGTGVRAAENGVVAYAGNELRGFGNLILLRHAGGWVTAYAHNDTLLVKRGDRISRDQVIAKSGASGNVKTPQVHFEIRKGSSAVNPQQYLSALEHDPPAKFLAGLTLGTPPIRHTNPG